MREELDRRNDDLSKNSGMIVGKSIDPSIKAKEAQVAVTSRVRTIEVGPPASY